MRTMMHLLALCLLITGALMSPTATADPTTVQGEIAGIPFSVGPMQTGLSCHFQYQTVDFGVLYSAGGGSNGECDFYVRAL